MQHLMSIAQSVICMCRPNLGTFQASQVKIMCGHRYFRHVIIIIMSHLLHENKSQVLIIQMVDMQMEQAKSYQLIQGLVPRAG